MLLKQQVQFGDKVVSYLFDAKIEQLSDIIDVRNVIVITEQNVSNYFKDFLNGITCIVCAEGESAKSIDNFTFVCSELLRLNAHKKSMIIGLGGGAVSDLVGFVASVFMRGIQFGFIPTTLLAMVDASVGGKNGINFQGYKNILGVTQQPQFILFDQSVLKSLPSIEWQNGMAEVIKYACLFDRTLFDDLLNLDVTTLQNNEVLVSNIIKKCVQYKNEIVLQDELDCNVRKLLNFGHTIGHALESRYSLKHGFAISIGMAMAAKISENINGNSEILQPIEALIRHFDLPTYIQFDHEEVLALIMRDKKRAYREIDFVLLKNVGEGYLKSISLDSLSEMLYSMQYDC